MNVSITSSKAFISRLLTNWPNSNQSVIECNDLSGFYFYPTECYGTSVENWLYWVNYPTVTPHNSIFNSFRTHRMVWLSEAKKMKLLNGCGSTKRRGWMGYMASIHLSLADLLHEFLKCMKFKLYWNTTLWQYRFTWSYRIFKIRHPGAISGT